MRNAVRRMMVWLMSGSLVFMGTPVIAQTDSYEAALARMEATLAEIQAIRDRLDRTMFDVEALSLALFLEDPAGLEAWVADNIAFQPYAGALRGAEGTLLNRAGNALDQSILLASLINRAGYEARIASARLDENQAAALVATTSAAPDRDYTALRELLEDVPGMDADMFFDDTPDAVRLGEAAGLSGAMLSALDGAGLELGDDRATVLADAMDYWWVEYRLGAGDWSAAHPAAPFLAEAGLVAESHLEDSVPEELQHRIRLEVLVESYNGGDVSVHAIVPAWERPASNMAGKVITFTNLPSQSAETLGESLDLSEYFVPSFMGGVPTGAKGFDLQGAVLEPEFMGNPMAGVVRSLRGGFADAISALGGGDDSVAMSAQWLVVTQIDPGGHEREYRRTVFDRIGAEARAAGQTTLDAMTMEEAELALITEYRLMAFPGELPLDYLLDVHLERMLEDRPMLEYTIALQHGVTPENSLADVINEASPLEHMLTMNMFETGPGGSVSFRAEPGLLVFTDSLAGTRDDARMVSRLDIMNNARRTVTPDGAVAVLDQGVWETLTERDLMGDETHNTANFNTDFMVIPAGGTAPEDLPAEARFNMQSDLNDGYAVLLPDGADAWWRVDLATGETLGITSDGRGQATTEYIIQAVDSYSTLIFAIKSYDDCTKSGGSMEAQLCCLMKAHASNVVGLGFGGFLTAGIGGVAGALTGLGFTYVTAATGADMSPAVLDIC